MTSRELCDQLLATFQGFVNHPLVVGAAIVDGEECVVGVEPTCHEGDRFEIGSIGKTMTATVLSTLILDGALSLSDEIGQWLNAGSNADITVGQLATHTSGLPRLAPNHAEHQVERNPYVAFGPDQAEEGLRSARRHVGDPATVYSNFGLQLLGLVLVRVAGMEYGEAVRARLWDPLGMHSTSVTGEQHPIVQGFRDGNPVPPWNALLPGPGLVTSTAADMARYLKAVITPPPTMVGEAIRHATEHNLAWSSTKDGWVWHNGGTAGAKTMLMAGPEAGRGAVALANSGGLDELEHAVALVARGQDPRPARPIPMGTEFDDVTNAVIEELIENRWDALRARMTEQMRSALPAEVLEGAWTNLMTPRGTFRAKEITSTVRAGQAVRAEVRLFFSDGEGWARPQFDDDRRLVALQVG